MRFHDEDRCRGLRQEFATVLDDHFSIAVGKESEMANLDEPARQDMQEEPSDELHRVERRLLNLIAVLRISPTEAHSAILQAEQSSIGNRHSMGVSRQVPQHLLWSAERGFDIDHPFLLLQRRQKILKTEGVGEFPDTPIELQAIISECLLQVSHKLAAK